jgi:hypothetical protein
MGWKLLGVDFHRWRSGRTILDLSHNSMLVHHGFYSLEWARQPHVEFYRTVREKYRTPRPSRSTKEET